MATLIDLHLCAEAIKRMYKESHFSICTIDKCSEVLGRRLSKEDYNRLHLLHCMHWNTMHATTKEYIKACIEKLFDFDDVSLSDDHFMPRFNKIPVISNNSQIFLEKIK